MDLDDLLEDEQPKQNHFKLKQDIEQFNSIPASEEWGEIEAPN